MAGTRLREPLEEALRALNRREHTVAELTLKLEGKGFDRDEIEPTIAELVETSALDDERFARLFNEDKRDLQGWGPERIERELAQRGIEQSLIDRCLGPADHEQEVERARGLIDQRSLPLDDERGRARALGVLTRRGYSYEVAYDAIRGAADWG